MPEGSTEWVLVGEHGSARDLIRVSRPRLELAADAAKVHTLRPQCAWVLLPSCQHQIGDRLRPRASGRLDAHSCPPGPTPSEHHRPPRSRARDLYGCTTTRPASATPPGPSASPRALEQSSRPELALRSPRTYRGQIWPTTFESTAFRREHATSATTSLTVNTTVRIVDRAVRSREAEPKYPNLQETPC